MLQTTRALALVTCACLAACFESSEATSVRIEVLPDLSGTIHVRAVAVPETAVAEVPSDGIDWSDRVALVASAGSFTSLDGVALLGIDVAASTDEQGVTTVQFTLPRGPDAAWARALSPLEPDLRRTKAMTLEPDGDTRELGRRIAVRLLLPGPVLSHGVYPRGFGVSSEVDGNGATLLVPVDVAREGDAPYLWQVAWTRE